MGEDHKSDDMGEDEKSDDNMRERQITGGNAKVWDYFYSYFRVQKNKTTPFSAIQIIPALV